MTQTSGENASCFCRDPGANGAHGHLLLPCVLPGECCEAEASRFPSGHQQHLQGRLQAPPRWREPEDEVPKVVPAEAESDQEQK